MTESFSIARQPLLLFGSGKVTALPSAIKSYGQKVLMVTGASSFLSSKAGLNLVDELRAKGVDLVNYTVAKEPTPVIIDEAVRKFSSFKCDVVIGIGGGSVLDAGKAISAMLPLNEPVKDYLEGVGTKTHPGVHIPFIAVPTTSGTGSEATKNAVIAESGASGYKKSLRHNNFVPDIAILDPELTINCPSSITGSSGMDAFTQLLESYVSTASNPITDVLAVDGLARVSKYLPKAFSEGTNIEARAGMSLAAYLSGITLANAGLGLVHGFASSIGGFFDIPHGVICSSLMPSCNRLTVAKLRRQRSNDAALSKYASVGRLFSGVDNKSHEYYTDYLLDLMQEWRLRMKIPGLRLGGVLSEHYHKIVQATDNKNNPIELERDEMLEILEAAS